MNTIFGAHGLRFAIFVEDHPPPHVRVIGDGRMKVELGEADGKPRIVWNLGMKMGDARKALREIAARRESLLVAWRRIHGK